MKPRDRSGEEGYLLLGLVVVCFLLLLVLSVAAPRVAKSLERDRELESEHRALEYVRAIQLYYRRNNSYPTSVEQLLGTGAGSTSVGVTPVRYLRQAYKDPLTGDDYRLIHQGEAKTTVKGFFGEELGASALGGGLGGSAAASMGGSTPGSPIGSSTTGTFSAVTPSSGSATSNPGSTTGTTGTGSSTGGTDATTCQGSKGIVVGIGSNAKGPGLVEWNGSANIEEWEFLYDPRVELLKQKVSLLGGSPAAAGSGSLGSGFAPVSGATGQPGSSTTSTNPTTPTPSTTP